MSTTSLFLVLLVLAVTQCHAKTALIAIDVQNCFLPGGSLAVPAGEEVIPVINEVRDLFDIVVWSQDWHCDVHVSFASAHPDYAEFTPITLDYGSSGDEFYLCDDGTGNLVDTFGAQNCSSEDITATVDQTLWPDHCVMNTTGAQLDAALAISDTDLFLKKGDTCIVDSYSVFWDNGDLSSTDLADILVDNEVDTLYVAGLATDFCVYHSVMDALELDFIVSTYLIQDAVRGISEDTSAAAIADMLAHGAIAVSSEDLLTSVDSASCHSPLVSMIVSMLFAFIIVF